MVTGGLLKAGHHVRVKPRQWLEVTQVKLNPHLVWILAQKVRSLGVFGRHGVILVALKIVEQLIQG
jgi:hypothetical protein